MTLSQSEALKVAEELFEHEVRPGDSRLVIDTAFIEEKNGMLIVPFNYPEYLETRDPMVMALDCWPVLVRLDDGSARLASIADRGLLNG